MNNYEQYRNMTIEQVAFTMMCPNESGLGLIDCDRSDARNCFMCCLEWLKQPAATCRECGCTATAACHGGCHWVEKDLCSKCASQRMQAAKAKAPVKPAVRATAPKPVPKPVQAPAAVPGSYKGFLWIVCPHCSIPKGFSAKNEIRSFYCNSCRKETLLAELKPLYINCECGKRFKYLTNLADKMADIPCLNCGSPVAVQYNPRTGAYETIRQQPRKR